MCAYMCLFISTYKCIHTHIYIYIHGTLRTAWPWHLKVEILMFKGKFFVRKPWSRLADILHGLHVPTLVLGCVLMSPYSKDISV